MSWFDRTERLCKARRGPSQWKEEPCEDTFAINSKNVTLHQKSCPIKVSSAFIASRICKTINLLCQDLQSVASGDLKLTWLVYHNNSLPVLFPYLYCWIPLQIFIIINELTLNSWPQISNTYLMMPGNH